jgi:RHS repeat-associated protein
LPASYTYDLADKMLTAGAKSYTYDAAGRTVGINAPGGTTTLTYDYESRVTAITGPGINETHTYNGLDTRVGTVQGGVSRTFVRDGSYVTDPVLRDGQATYTPGVSERRGGVSTWSHSGLKNVDAQTTSVGAIAATRVYDAFGAELSATGTWKGPFGYAGGFGYQEDSSGLKLLGHRYYDPTTGRFLSRDKIKDGANWYAYAANNPVSITDPSGLIIETIADIIGIAWDIWDIAHDPTNPWAWGGLVWSVVATFVPFLPGSYVAKLGGKAAKFDWNLIFKGAGKGSRSRDEFVKHLTDIIEYTNELQKKKDELSRARRHADRQRLKAEIAQLQKGIKGHEKEMDEKWSGWRDEVERFKNDLANEGD